MTITGDLDFAEFENLGSEIPKSGGDGSNRNPDGIDDCKLNLSKYLPYGPNNSVFLCLLWNENRPNADVAVDENTSVDNMLMALPGFQNSRIPLKEIAGFQEFQDSCFIDVKDSLVKNPEIRRTNTNNTKPKVAKSETIGANHLGFAKSLFQHYCQYLGLNHNHISTKSAFNFYVNEKISSLLRTPVNTESARETFYKELIQNTNVPTNHNFTSIITEINKEIEHHTQQRYPITYASKGKRKLQTPAVTPKKIQPPAWKKNRVEFPSNPSYHYTPGSAINILSTDTFPSTTTSAFGRFPFRIKTPNLQTQQQLENLEIKTPNIRTPPNQRNQGPELINQQNLPPVIVINQLPINPIAEPIQQPLQLPPQQSGQQQLLQQPSQPPNLDPMAYAPIAKLDNFTGTFQDAVTCARDFKSVESEANHAQAVNLVINGSSELDSKLEKFIPKLKPNCLSISDAVISLSVSSVSSSNLLTAATSDLSTTAATNNLSIPTDPNTTPKLTTQRNPKTKNDSTKLEIGNSSPSTDPQFFTATIWITPAEFDLLVTPEDASTNNLALAQKQLLTSNIPPATITEDESLDAIFPFEFEETAATSLFSGAAFEAKPITAMYTDAKVEGQSIKLILDSGSAGSIITRQLMDQLGHRVDRAASARIITINGATKTPISEIDDFPFKVNDIVTSIKVLVMEATQYQALVENDWLSKINATLDWNTQELQLTYQGQHIHVPAMCGHFKTPPREKLLIELDKEKEKPIWETYQVSWADEEHNKLPPILSWDNNNKEKEKQKEELIWETDDLTWTDNDESELTSSWEWEKDKENKGKGKRKETTQTTTTYNTHTISQQSTYHRPKLICVNCSKKLSSMSTHYGDNEKYHTATKFYCYLCMLKHFGQPKR
ncbi:hypothetical protein G9A89_005778 [Geosiphon pyriformis]|nr:hypothetical protein G9A89_005778 [Geosiphon pyriformis]